MFVQAPKHEARQQMATQLAKAGIWPQNDKANSEENTKYDHFHLMISYPLIFKAKLDFFIV